MRAQPEWPPEVFSTCPFCYGTSGCCPSALHTMSWVCGQFDNLDSNNLAKYKPHMEKLRKRENNRGNGALAFCIVAGVVYMMTCYLL